MLGGRGGGVQWYDEPYGLLDQQYAAERSRSFVASLFEP